MSASREKKNRQDLTQQEGYVDAKAQKAAEEKRAQRKSNALYITVAIIFVVVGIFLGITKSGVLQRNATALTIDGEKFTPAQVDYFYYTALNSIQSSEYASYMALDKNTALDKQTVNDMAKMLLGIAAEEDLTWDAYLKDSAKQNLTQLYRLYQAAVENGYGVTEDVQTQIDQNHEALASYASMAGYSPKEYLKMVYGSNMTESTFDKMLTMVLVAGSYDADRSASLTYTDAELEAYYQGDKDCFDFADIEYIFFKGTADSTTDANGNTVEPTDAENAAAAEAAKAAVDEAAARYADEESLEDIAADYEDIATYTYNMAMANSGTELSNWAFDATRTAGETATLDVGNGQYFVLFHSAGRSDYYAADVRHILFNADTSALDPESATYDADVEAVWEETRAKAQDALEKWQSGAKTADSFAELANELSEDPGSNTTGGLYASITKDSNYVPTFKGWCFEEGRKVGDVGIVESSYGCHVMYLDKFADTLYWKQMVQSEMAAADYSEWMESLTADAVVVEGSGMKYVG